MIAEIYLRLHSLKIHKKPKMKAKRIIAEKSGRLRGFSYTMPIMRKMKTGVRHEFVSRWHLL